MHARMPLTPVVVKEGDGFQAITGLERQFVGQDGPGIAGPDDGHALFTVTVFLAGDRERLTEGAQGETRTGQSHQAKDKIQDNNPSWRRETLSPNAPDDHSDNGTDSEGVEHPSQVWRAEVTQERVELVEESQEKQLQRYEPTQDEEPLMLKLGLHQEIEAQFVGQPEAGCQLEGGDR